METLRCLHQVDFSWPVPEFVCFVHDDEVEPVEMWAIGVIDWEMAKLGDPPYDLAIVTRGHRKVCGVGGDLHVLIAAYRESGSGAISESDVRRHAILLALNWLKEAWRE